MDIKTELQLRLIELEKIDIAETEGFYGGVTLLRKALAEIERLEKPPRYKACSSCKAGQIAPLFSCNGHGDRPWCTYCGEAAQPGEDS